MMHQKKLDLTNWPSIRNRGAFLAAVCGLAVLIGATGCQKNGTSVDQQESPSGTAPGGDMESQQASPESESTQPPPSLEPTPDESGAAANQQSSQQQPLQLGAQGGDAGGSPMAQFQQLQQRLKEIDAELGKIQEEVSDNEELQKARKSLETAAIDKMEESSPEVEEDLEALKELGKKIESSGEVGGSPGEMSAETKSDIQEFREKQKEIAKLEQKAMADPKIQALQQEYQDKMLAALKEADPRAEKLIEERKQLIKELQSIQKQLIQQKLQQQGGGAPAPQPPPAPAPQGNSEQPEQ